MVGNSGTVTLDAQAKKVNSSAFSPLTTSNNLSSSEMPTLLSANQVDDIVLTARANNFYMAKTKWITDLTNKVEEYEDKRSQRFFSARIRKKQVAQIQAALQDKTMHYSLLYNELYKVFSQIKPAGFWGRKSELYIVLEEALSLYNATVVPAANSIEARNAYLFNEWNKVHSQHLQASNQVSNLIDEVAALKAERNSLRDALEVSQVSEKKLSEQVKQLDLRLEGARSANIGLRAEGETKNTTITQLKAKLKESEDEKIKLSKDLEELTQKNEKLKTRNKAFRRGYIELNATNEANALYKQQYQEAVSRITELTGEIETIMAYLNKQMQEKYAAEEKLRHEESRTKRLINFINNLIKSFKNKVFSGLNEAEEREYSDIINSEPSLVQSKMDCRQVTLAQIKDYYATKEKFTNANYQVPVKQSSLIDLFGSVFAPLTEATAFKSAPTIHGEFPLAVSNTVTEKRS